MENKLLYKDDVKEYAKGYIQNALYFGIATAGALVATYFALDVLPLHIILACVAAVTLSMTIRNLWIVVLYRSVKIEIYIDRIETVMLGKRKTVYYNEVESFAIQQFPGDKKTVNMYVYYKDPNTGEKYQPTSNIKKISHTRFFRKYRLNRQRKKGYTLFKSKSSVTTKYYRELASLIGPHKCDNIDSLAIR